MEKSAKDLRVLFWNVKDWGRRGNASYEDSRTQAIANIIEKEGADISCFAEIVDPAIKYKLSRVLPPGYTISEVRGKSHHKLMVVLKNNARYNVITHQNDDIDNADKGGRAYPYIEVSGQFNKLAILPIHSKSGSHEKSMTIRYNSLQKIAGLAASLEKDRIPLLVLGDMNTMGDGRTLTGEEEIDQTRKLLYDPTTDKKYTNWEPGHLIALPKDHPFTWKGIDSDSRYPEGNFDHAFLSEPLANSIKKAFVQVKGWPEKTGVSEQDEWVRDYSDHAYLVVDIPDFAPVP